MRGAMTSIQSRDTASARLYKIGSRERNNLTLLLFFPLISSQASIDQIQLKCRDHRSPVDVVYLPSGMESSTERHGAGAWRCKRKIYCPMFGMMYKIFMYKT